MKARTLLPIIAVLLIIVSVLVIIAWKTQAKLVKVSPLAGENNIADTTSIRLEFSRPMDQSSVISHLAIEPAMDGGYSWTGNSLVFTPSKPWESGQQVTVSLESGARAASWLAFPAGRQSWTFTTSESTLVYLWPADGAADIYALDPVTGSIRHYTQGMDVLELIANPDGHWLYFSAGNSQGGSDLYQIDRIMVDSSLEQVYQPEKLLDCGVSQCRNPAISADGTTLAYEYLLPKASGSLGPAQIWSLKLAGLVATPVGQAGHETVQPAWSPDGLLAYYDRTDSAYEIYNPASQARLQLPNQTGQPGAWSPDGQYYLAPEISYQPSDGSHETGSSHLLRYDIQDQGIQDLSGKGAVEDVEAAYSPDGSMIAFTRKYLDANRWSPGRQLWLMGSDGSDPHPLSEAADYNHYDLAWSRDGSMLAYVRFNQVKISDPPELWMVDQGGNQPLQLVIGGYSPLWIP